MVMCSQAIDKTKREIQPRRISLFCSQITIHCLLLNHHFRHSHRLAVADNVQNVYARSKVGNVH